MFMLMKQQVEVEVQKKEKEEFERVLFSLYVNLIRVSFSEICTMNF